MFKKLSILVVFFIISYSAESQLSQERLIALADIKVERFQNILDLKSSQAKQLQKETINLLQAHSNFTYNIDIIDHFNRNLEMHYTNLTTFTPQQLATLKMMDSLDRQSRRVSYENLMAAFGYSPKLAFVIASYNWNTSVPILVSYRKDLDNYISQNDKIIIAQMREMMISKYDFINKVRTQNPSEESENIVSLVQDEILTIISDSKLPAMLDKYEEQLDNIRSEMKSNSSRIKKDIRSIYNTYVVEDHQHQIADEGAFLEMVGVSKLIRSSFFLLMDGESRSITFKINALHLMANSLLITDQF